VKPRTYQLALTFTVVVCLALAAALAYVLFYRGRATAQMAVSSDPVVARGPEVAARPAAPAATDSTPLAPIQLSPQRLQSIGVTFATARLETVNDSLKVPGNVDIDEEKISYVQTRFPGWIQNVFANATYQYVRKGQQLFTIYSPDLVSSEQEYLLAKQNEKTLSLEERGMATKEGGWLLEAAAERLRQFDIPAQAIADLEMTGKVQRDIAIDSPVSGYITERNALPNAYVEPATKLYSIADLSTVWVYAAVSQLDIGRLKPGDQAKVTVDAYPGRTFGGRVDQILPQLDQATRTVRVRLVLSNPGVTLKPGMYVEVEIALSLGRQLVIPASAALQSGERAIAFVDRGNGILEPRTIQVGPQIGDSAVVLAGLKPGEQVVSSANFLVDSEAQLQAAMGTFAPPPPLPSASVPAPASQVKIDISTDPSPPRMGSNTVRVQITNSDGRAVTGVRVTATFFMAAMPAMGMAAQRATADLSEKGNGSYEGSVQLPSGGTWTATVTVERNGQVVATKQLSVSAVGGMA